MFDDVLKPKTLPVYVYYGHLTSSEWMTFLDNIESQVENEALALKAYFDKHPGITGLVLQHIDVSKRNCFFTALFLFFFFSQMF